MATSKYEFTKNEIGGGWNITITRTSDCVEVVAESNENPYGKLYMGERGLSKDELSCDILLLRRMFVMITMYCQQ